ncbi:MAG TPA: hypothetical protein VHG91_08485, partial [Longimicrobium sp.]|nr:hypothetical protein [Longimicrobium sp.]
MTAVQLRRLLSGAPPQYHDCIAACVECLAACEAAAGQCLQEEPATAARVRCIRLSRDCAEACALAVRVMAYGEGSVAEVARMCARLADACADELFEVVRTEFYTLPPEGLLEVGAEPGSPRELAEGNTMTMALPLR